MPLKRRKIAKPWLWTKKLPDFAAGEKDINKIENYEYNKYYVYAIQR